MENETKDLITFTAEEIRQSQALAGQEIKTSIPFVPILTINNTSENKVVEIDGVKKEVTVPAEKGFTLLTKEDNKYEKELLKGDTYGVILKERYQIEKKYNPMDTEVRYKSAEFDNWYDNIEIYNINNRKEILATGDYKYLKGKFTTTDEKGEKRKDYNLYVILYVNHLVTGKIVRIKLKMTADINWFDYRNSFKENEPWAGWITEFKLKEKTNGDIKYWYIEMVRGDKINLVEQLKLQLEINKFFMAQKKAYETINDVKPIEQQVPEITTEGSEVVTRIEKDKNGEFSSPTEEKLYEITASDITAKDPNAKDMTASNLDDIKIEDIPF